LTGWPLPALLLAGLLASPPPEHPDETRAFRYLMGTSVEIQAFGGEVEGRKAAVEEAFAAIAEVDRLMSNYREDSELSLVNREAAKGPVRVSDPLFAVLSAAESVSEKSGGVFDVTVGPLVRLWGFHDKTPHVPTGTELAGVRPLVGRENLVLDPVARTVRFGRAGVELDLGGIAKGFAVEIAGTVLRKHGLFGIVDAGGNQYLVGRPAGDALWTVGVRDPAHAGRLLGVLRLGEGSVSTSSQGANFLEASGRRYGHILDPRSLKPSEASLSATIVSRDGTLADALSKVAFILGPEEGLRALSAFPGVEALIAYQRPDGSVGLAFSSGLRDHFEPARPGE
jgi:thiamine biosynthesis lipoprotein